MHHIVRLESFFCSIEKILPYQIESDRNIKMSEKHKIYNINTVFQTTKPHFYLKTGTRAN